MAHSGCSMTGPQASRAGRVWVSWAPWALRAPADRTSHASQPPAAWGRPPRAELAPEFAARVIMWENDRMTSGRIIIGGRVGT